jgi:D-alanyl-D-alanine carboxypeptidase
MQRLEAVVDRGVAASPQVRSVTVALAVPGRGGWSMKRHAADEPASGLFHWGSAGKMFTAAVILQLVEEGRLRLDDPVAKWAPGVPNARAITIEHLLNHTSGLFSVNEDLRVRLLRRRLSFDDQVKVMVRHGAMFCPGERWRYTNSGYAILGRIIELTDGRPYAASVRARVIEPLGLKETYALAPDEPTPPMARIVSVTKERSLDALAPGAAGAIVASAPDMIAFLQAYLDGRVVSPAMVSRLLAQSYPGFGDGAYFGLGMMLFDVPDTPRNLLLIGHAGGGPGVNAIVGWSPQDRAFVAAAITGGGSSAAFANGVLKAYAAGEASRGGGAIP